ncbi:hypothetical protein ACPOM7_17535 [Peribacillus castrilensis]|uniref:hypothetical protein n=1 Tax=Bacillaceae TaxID=186817 RepID=UPI00065F70E2|nr:MULTISPECIES: hypothetical protein [Bacillaceae]MCT1390139.1 hypothetical protein [Peribacillus frigoritolerans]PRA81582.1 hypothetical protein CQ056_20495 [Peribacillus simplex]
MENRCLEKTCFDMTTMDEKGKIITKVTVEGDTNMPSWNHDLKFKAVMSLLCSIDKKHFDEYDMGEKYYEYILELKELVHHLEMD